MLLAGGILLWGADEALAQSDHRSVCLDSSGSAAVTACKATLRAAPADVKVARALARHYSTAKRFNEALEVLNGALAHNPGNDRLLSDISVAKSNLAEQEWLKNRKTADSNDGIGAAKPVNQMERIRCQKLSGATALAACERALAAQPNDPDLRVARARHLESMGQTAKAIADYRVALASDPDNAEARNRLAALVPKPAVSELSKPPTEVAEQGKAPASKPSLEDQLALLKRLKKRGLVDDDEYQRRRKALLDSALAAGVAEVSPQTAAIVETDMTARFLESVQPGEFYALVIGNNAYASLPDLATAVFDAQVVAEVLRQKYRFKVTLLLDASRYDILKAMADYRHNLTERDNLLIYYAGHGQLDHAAERGYWLPVDAEETIKANWISTADITDMLKASDAWHVLVVADSCYSGTLVRGALSPVQGGGDQLALLRRLAEKRSRTVLTSGGLEPVTDGGGGGHSVFAKAFIDTLRENDSVIDAESVFKMIREYVVVNSDQTPEYSDVRKAGHDGGDFVFVPRRP
jgi:tetratricopeptide (TPR) repeat protein